MIVATRTVSAYYCQASYIYRGIISSKREYDGSSLYGDKEEKLFVLVLTDDSPSLLSRDWLQHLKLDWQQINKLHSEALQQVLQRHEDVFKDGLGTLEGYKAKILHIIPGVAPRFCKVCSLPYCMLPFVEKELDRLVAQGIIEPVQFADWVVPIVPIFKQSTVLVSYRICSDFKLIVYQASSWITTQFQELKTYLRSWQVANCSHIWICAKLISSCSWMTSQKIMS